MSTWNNLVPNRNELHELKRKALLRGAVAGFNQKGFHATSLEDIATSLGVTKTALYHYFPNKHALLYESFVEALRVAFESLEEAKKNGRNGLEKLQMTMYGYLKNTLDELSRCLFLTEEHALLPEQREVVFEGRDRFEYALRDFVREGIEDGSIIPCDPKLAVFSILGGVNWVPKWFSADGAWTHEQLAQAMSQLLCRAIAKNPAAELPTDVSKI